MLARSIRFRRYLPIRLTQYISALPFSHFIHRFCSDYAGEQCSPLRVEIGSDQDRGSSLHGKLFRFSAKIMSAPLPSPSRGRCRRSRRMRWNQIRALCAHLTYSLLLFHYSLSGAACRGEGVGASRRMRWNQIRAAAPHTYSYQLSAIEKTAVCAAVFHISSTDKTLGRAVMAGTSSVPLILGVACTDKSA